MTDYTSICQQINEKSRDIIKEHSDMIEKTIQQLIIDNDCKPSDIHIHIKGNMHYAFLVKKHECKTEINYVWGLKDDNQ